MSVLFVKLHMKLHFETDETASRDSRNGTSRPTKRHLETDETASRDRRNGTSRLTKRHLGTDETADSEDEAEGSIQLGGEHVEQ